MPALMSATEPLIALPLLLIPWLPCTATVQWRQDMRRAVIDFFSTERCSVGSLCRRIDANGVMSAPVLSNQLKESELVRI